MKMNKKAFGLATASILALALTACSNGGGGGASGGDESSVTTFKVATVAGIVGNAAIHLGVEQGFFEEEGLKLDISEVQNPPAGLAAVQGGQVDIGYAPSIPALNALSQGVGLKVVMAADGYSDDKVEDLRKVDDTSLYANPKSGITDVKQLAGKRISVPARKAQLEVVITAMLQDNGVDPSSIDWVTLDFQSALEAVKNNQVDVASLVDPFSAQAEAAGMTYLGAPSYEFFGAGAAVGLWLTGDSTWSKHKDAIEAFQRAIKKSNEYANAHLQEAKQKSAELVGGDVDLDTIVDAYWPLTVKEADIQNVNEKLVKLGFLKKPADLKGFILPQP